MGEAADAAAAHGRRALVDRREDGFGKGAKSGTRKRRAAISYRLGDMFPATRSLARPRVGSVGFAGVCRDSGTGTGIATGTGNTYARAVRADKSEQSGGDVTSLLDARLLVEAPGGVPGKCGLSAVASWPPGGLTSSALSLNPSLTGPMRAGEAPALRCPRSQSALSSAHPRYLAQDRWRRSWRWADVAASRGGFAEKYTALGATLVPGRAWGSGQACLFGH